MQRRGSCDYGKMLPSNQRILRRIECAQESERSCGMSSAFLDFLESPTPGFYPRVRCSGPATIASNLEIFGRGLAAIGNLFVFDRLSFVERGKASFLDRRNMNKNVLAATGRLDESKTLGRVEPLHSTFSHHVVSAGSKIITGCRSPQTGTS